MGWMEGLNVEWMFFVLNTAVKEDILSPFGNFFCNMK